MAVTIRVDQPSPFAPRAEWDAYVARLKALLEQEPGNKFLTNMLKIAQPGGPWKTTPRPMADYNPNHVQSGPHGGEFASGHGGGVARHSLPKKYHPKNFAELKECPVVQSVDDGRPNDTLFVNLEPEFYWSGQRSFGVETVGEALRLMKDVYWEGVGNPPWSTIDSMGDRYNPNQPRDPGGEGGGQWIAAGASGIAGMDEVEPLTSEAKDAMAKANEGKDVDQIRLEAGFNQVRLREVGQDIQDRIGVTFAEPPKGFEVKSRDSILRKVASENYDGPHQLRDISRATFVVPTATKADMVIGALASKGTVYDRGWSRDVNSGYAARFVYLKHPNGGVSEIQIVPDGLAQIKMGDDLHSNGPGHVLYEVMRDPSKSMEVRRTAARKSRTLYNRALGKTFYSVVGVNVGAGH
jgi:hypothetical protein